MRFITVTGFVLLILFAGEVAAHEQARLALRYVDLQQSAPDALVIDTRTLAQCQQRSIDGAHCLPARDLIGPRGELPNFADIFWALGTAGIDGSETVLVTGDNARQRDYVAGMLYLCGQTQVQVLKTSIEQVLRERLRLAGSGLSRGMLRQRIYHAVMRDKYIVLPGELQRARHMAQYIVPIDADSDSEAQGKLAEGIENGDRRPGIHLLSYVIHAAKTMDAIALFTRLQARVINQHTNLKVMPASDNIWSAGANDVKTSNVLTVAKKTNNKYAENNRQAVLVIGLVSLVLAAMLMLVSILPKGGKQWI